MRDQGKGTAIPKSAVQLRLRLRLLSEPWDEREMRPMVHRGAPLVLPEGRQEQYVTPGALRSRCGCERKGRLSAKQLFQLCCAAPVVTAKYWHHMSRSEEARTKRGRAPSANFRGRRSKGLPAYGNLFVARCIVEMGRSGSDPWK